MQSVILGTAQWGLDYGVTNEHGRLADEGIAAVIVTARRRGVRLLDTAPGYGDAETRIGEQAFGFEIQSKVSVAARSARDIRSSLEASLGRLRRESLGVALIHDWASAGTESRLGAVAELEDLREEGLVAAVGISAYDEQDLQTALDSFGSLDVVQVPVSVLDQRLLGSRAVAAVRARGGRVQARSVLLQGAALAPADHAGFGMHPDVVRLRQAGDPLRLCLGFIRSLSWVDELVIAATTSEELEQAMFALGSPVPSVDWSTLASGDPWLVDPRRWTASTSQG